MAPPPPWQRRRTAFNHDWLKNQLCVTLGKAVNVLAGRINDPAFLESFPGEVLADWAAHRSEALALPASFEHDMSPRALFEVPPLNRLPASVRGWLPDVVHALWRQRYHVETMVDTALRAARSADEAFRDLAVAAEPGRLVDSGASCERRLPSTREVRARCEDLARAIERFPSGVRVL